MASTCFIQTFYQIKIHCKRVCDKKEGSNDVNYFMCSGPSKMEMKSLSERFPLGKKPATDLL